MKDGGRELSADICGFTFARRLGSLFFFFLTGYILKYCQILAIENLPKNCIILNLLSFKINFWLYKKSYLKTLRAKIMLFFGEIFNSHNLTQKKRKFIHKFSIHRSQ